MHDIPRRNIDELVARYDLEPELKDVYVEGIFDKEVLAHCFQKNREVERVIYDIGSVNVPINILAKYGLTDGNKQRVIALAKELSCLPGQHNYRCIVDKDLDHWIDSIESVPRLSWTEHSSIELYFFTKETLNDVLIVTAKSKIKSLETYIDSLAKVLKFLYALRLASHTLRLNLTWLDASKCLSVNGDEIRINQSKYIDNILNSNASMQHKGVFQEKVDLWLERLTGDRRDHIRGHDFVEILAWTIKEFKGLKELSSSTCIERLFILIADRTTQLLQLVK